MQFFQAQDNARRNTGFLALLFAAAALCIVAALSAVIYVFIAAAETGAAGKLAAAKMANIAPGAPLWTGVDFYLLLNIAAAVLAFIAALSVGKIIILACGGGEAVASGLGGRLLNTGTNNAAEKRLLNIVEEIALAAGTAPPKVYALPDKTINAFAAGTKPANAVIGVTQGAMERLSREEMQGVIAHEFSHIMNGDMLINLRLTGVIHSIMFFGIVGYVLTRTGISTTYAARGSREGAPIAAIALGLIVAGLAIRLIGGIGSFFGNWIRAALSRQREFLADAAAVQYTRNPQSIGGALEQIGVEGGLLSNPNAAENAHYYFAKGISGAFAGMFSTHPPIEQRILRVMPDWNPEQMNKKRRQRKAKIAQELKEPPQQRIERQTREGLAAGMATVAAMAAQTGAAAATPTDNINNALGDSYSARALIYALLLDDNANFRGKQLQWLRDFADEGVYEITLQLADAASGSRARAAALALRAVPALREMSPKQYKMFADNMEALIVADSAVSLSEWSIVAVVEHFLAPHFGAKPARAQTEMSNAKAMGYPLSLLARAGNGEKAEQVLKAAAKKAGTFFAYNRGEFVPQKLFSCMQAVSRLGMLNKRRFITVAEECAKADGKISADEYLLLTAYAAILDTPIPPQN